jgi:transcription initiation factor TFIID TATA-box-binding protein
MRGVKRGRAPKQANGEIPAAVELYFPNTVCTLKLHTKLNLIHVSHIFQSKYDPLVFPAVVVKCHNTDSTVLIFESGDILITGAKAIDDPKRATPGIDIAILTAQLTAYRLSQCLHIHLQLYEIRVPNIVASQALGFALDIRKLRTAHKAHTEKGRFPGLRITADEIGVTFIVFRNGHINVTGIRGEVTGEQRIPKLEAIKEMILSFHKYRDWVHSS